MLRWITFLLVLGNIILFALGGGWLGGRGEVSEAGGESHQPLSADRIRIVGRGDPPPVVDLPKQCREWPDLVAGQVGELERLLGNGKSFRLVREQIQAGSVRYKVFIPAPTGGKVVSEKKAAELKTLGVKEFRLEQEGGTERWAISFGVFVSETEASAALDFLKKSGVRSATVGMVDEVPAHFRVRIFGTAAAFVALQRTEDFPASIDCAGEFSGATALAR